MSTVDPKDLQNRDRTFADRKAFVLSEQAIETEAPTGGVQVHPGAELHRVRRDREIGLAP